MHRLCGTRPGYTRHLEFGEVPCDACLAAHRDYIRRWRNETTRCASELGWPVQLDAFWRKPKRKYTRRKGLL